MQKRAVIYARYSSDRQREESIEGQLRECQEYAEHQGYTVIQTYIDRAYSAKADDRPAFQEMISDCSKQLFDAILVWKLDRFARDRYDSAHYKSLLKRSCVKLISVTENSSDGPDGIMMEALLEGMAEYYSAELGQKIRRGQQENALKCRSNGGTVPFGYCRTKAGEFQVDETLRPIVLEIFTRYADGETAKAITDALNTRGLKSQRGNPFNKNSLHNMISNRWYLGEYHYRDVSVPDGIPAIIDIKLFERASARLSQNRCAPARSKAREDFLLTTKLFCGLCGESMSGESGTSRTGDIHYYYKCMGRKRAKNCRKKTVYKELIELLVVDAVVQLIMSDEVINCIGDAVLEVLAQESAALPKLNADLQDVTARLNNLLKAIEQGLFSASTKARLDALEEEKSALELSIAQESLRRPLLTREQVLFWLKQFRIGNITDIAYQKRLIDYFANAIYLYDDKLLLLINYKDGTKTIPFDLVKGSDLFFLQSFCPTRYFHRKQPSKAMPSGAQSPEFALRASSPLRQSCSLQRMTLPRHVSSMEGSSSTIATFNILFPPCEKRW